MNILLDEGIFRNNIEESQFIKIANANDHRCVVSSMVKTMTVDDFNEHYEINKNDVFVYGTIPFVRRLSHHGYKGNFLATINNIYFYDELFRLCGLSNNAEYILNSDSHCMYGLLNNRDYYEMISEFLSNSSVTDRVFVKPNNPYKTHPSRVVDVNDLFGIVSDDKYGELVKGFYCAPYKEIQHEVRCIYYGRKIITGSYYIIDDEIKYERVDDLKPFVTVMKNLRGLEVNKSSMAHKLPLVVDFAYHEDQWKLLEFNCLSTSGLYECDLEKILQAVDRSLQL